MAAFKKKSSRADHFEGTRQKRRSQSAEDYTEIVADLIKSKGEARVCDVAREMGVSHVTVVKTIKRLASQGLFITVAHQPIELTARGKRLAALSKKKHQVLTEFLRKLGVPQHVLEIDVEGIEHHISPITLKAIIQHMKAMPEN